MDKILRAEIVKEVRQAMMEVNERYVTADVLCQHIGTLTKRFLKEHGQMLDRTRIEWTDSKGVKHRQEWLYPLNKMKLMLASGQLKELVEENNFSS
jgi:hypothetical protein